LLINRLKPVGGSPSDPSEIALEEYLPEGSYQLVVSLSDADTSKRIGEARRDIVVPRGNSPLDMPAVALEQPHFQKLASKPAPEIDATDKNNGKPVKLEDFRGKVVLLEFWGYWCGPCVGNMPYLMDFYRKFKGRPLEIVALHDQSVQSRDAYDRKVATARERIWGGRDLPFRVLFDRPEPKGSEDENIIGRGTTIEHYGITGFPTLFVIDRDGTMVAQVAHTDHERLESVVRSLVEKAEKR
jgi:thiol-disulfide isomerase/thioredoxin